MEEEKTVATFGTWVCSNCGKETTGILPVVQWCNECRIDIEQRLMYEHFERLDSMSFERRLRRLEQAEFTRKKGNPIPIHVIASEFVPDDEVWMVNVVDGHPVVVKVKTKEDDDERNHA